MIRLILALILAFALPAASIADDHHRGGDSHGSGRSSGASAQYRAAPSARYSAPQQREYSAPQQRGYSAPQQRGYSAPQQRAYSTPEQRVYSAPQQRGYTQGQRTYAIPQQQRYAPEQHDSYGYSGRESTASQSRFSGRSYNSGPFRARQFSGSVVANPHGWGGWGWNHGFAWYPMGGYWGGGFWGSWALDTLAEAVLFGSVIDYESQAIYPSYAVEPQSPGAELLENYGLQQTQCGPPSLVVIWGPDNSVICAYPNDMVAPGNYELDPETLTITSSS